MGKRILVADDSLTIQKAFAMVLGGEDYTLLTARSVDEAVVVAKGGRPDLVIADVVLGAGNGYDLCASLKADPALRGVPVHILSSSQNPLDEARARRAGADGHLLKPFDSQTLLDSVSAALLAPARPAPAPVAEAPAAPARLAAPAAPWPPIEPAVVTDEVLAPEDDDSYGEFTIERSSAAGPAAWASRPPTWPGARPVPTAAPLPSTGGRPSLIPGVSASTPAPASRPAPPLPGVTAAPPAASPARPSRTIMGFPAVGGSAQAPSTPPVPPAAARPPVPRPSAPPPTPRAAPPIPVAAAPAPPPAVAVQAPLRRSASMPVAAPAATPVPPTAAAPQTPARRSGGMPVVAPAGAPAPLVAAVSSAIDQKVAAIAARGREYEAIAKLSREIIEQVVWEVVPELAEVIIRQELDRLAAAKK